MPTQAWPYLLACAGIGWTVLAVVMFVPDRKGAGDRILRRNQAMMAAAGSGSQVSSGCQVEKGPPGVMWPRVKQKHSLCMRHQVIG
jgi:hypothetical protein